MSKKSRIGRLGAGAMVVALAFAACGGSGTESKGTVNIALNPWVGYTADAAVVAYLLETELGYTVVQKDLKEDVSWQGFESGEVDVIMENWGHPDLEKIYIDEKKVAMFGGDTGNVGIIGWYVPGWMVDEHPDITDWNNQKEPLLLYWWDTHWIHAQVKLVQIKLPEYAEGCDADLEKVACDYPSYNLNKVISTKFNDNGGDAATFVKNFNWTNADQNLVADYITNQGMTAEAAAKKWADDNESVWKAWLP